MTIILSVLRPGTLLLLLALMACSNGEGLPVGLGKRGNTLILVIEDISRVQEIRYQGTDEKHYLVVPSDANNELVVLKINVFNEKSTRLLITVDEAAAELRGFNRDEDFRLLDPRPENTTNVRMAEGPHPSENLHVPFLIGPFELPQGFSVIGWIAFDVPKGLRLREMRWNAGDTIFIRS